MDNKEIIDNVDSGYSSAGIDIENMEGIEYLKKIENNSINLILTDPPYIISKDSGMNKKHIELKKAKENGEIFIKTENDWIKYKEKNNLDSDECKEVYLKYKL